MRVDGIGEPMYDPSPEQGHPFVIVGVMPHQAADVVLTAASFATRIQAELVCAYVDLTRYTVEEAPDGTVTTFPIDPEVPDVIVEQFNPALAQEVETLLSPLDVRWSLRALAGDPAQALARLSDTFDAELIVVGTRRTGIRASMHEFFGGSVAVHLAHRQHRPVLVVPLDPVGPGEMLPWEQ
jgi:nucleotide-binding universal stress UspA family protein